MLSVFLCPNVHGCGSGRGCSGFELPAVDLPPVPEFLRDIVGRGTDAEFTVIFVDDTLRITEGDRGELRIFVRDAMSALI